MLMKWPTTNLVISNDTMMGWSQKKMETLNHRGMNMILIVIERRGV